jgi:hypothetical protein
MCLLNRGKILLVVCNLLSALLNHVSPILSQSLKTTMVLPEA